LQVSGSNDIDYWAELILKIPLRYNKDDPQWLKARIFLALIGTAEARALPKTDF
jgi:hypothetical protein